MGTIPWDRAVCAGEMVLAGLLLARAWPVRVARVGWMLLLIGGLAFAGILNVAPRNRLNTNVVQQYLGAKYSVPYDSFYRTYRAALDLPPFGIRDLDHPPARIGIDPREQRAWWIELLRAEGVEFDPLASTDALERKARTSGALTRSNDRALWDWLRPAHVESFRRDVRIAAEALGEQDPTQDYGYNGSPFYSLVRRLDPTLHRPLSPATGLWNLLFQSLALLALAATTGAALGWSWDDRLAAAAILTASWDVTAYALAGLTFGELWVPIALGALAWRRGRPGLAGVCVAWAGLMKLFPFVLVVPAVGRLVRHDLHRDLHRDGQRYSGADHRTGRQAALRFLLSCLLATVAGAALALLTGRSWLEFWHKIVVQFQSQAYLMNSVSLSQLLLAAGVSSAAARGIWAAAAWAALLIETIRFEDREDQTGVRRGWFVALAGIGLAVHTWFNYYAVAALLLVPVFARRHRVEGAAICAALAASTLLPDFDDPALRLHRGLLLLKIVPYVYLAVRFLLEEAAPRRFGRRARRAAIVALVLLVAATAAEGWRGRAVRRLDDEIGRCLERRDLSGAVAAAHQQVRLAPRSVACRLNLGIALATDGRSAEAGEQFLRAVALDRNDSFARRNYGHWLRQSGRAEEAVRELQAACALVLWDDGSWVELARAQREAGDVDAAVASSARARELRPENPGARTGE